MRTHYVHDFARLNPEPWEVAQDDIITYLSRQDWAPETRRGARTSLRAFYRWAHETGRCEKDPTLGIPAVRVPGGVPRPTPEAVVARALDRASQQGRLMILLAAYAGLRRAEIAQVHSDDLTAQGLRIKGKGGKVRVVPIHPLLAPELARIDGWAFPSPVHLGQHVGVDYIAHKVTDLLGPGWTCHTLRHRFATRAYAGTRDIRSVQTLLGHSSPDTTARYVAIAHDDLAAAVLSVA